MRFFDFLRSKHKLKIEKEKREYQEVDKQNDIGDKVHMHYVSEFKKSPKKEGNDFIYVTRYNCILNDNADSGGIVEVQIISPRKLNNREIKNMTVNTPQAILSWITSRYTMIEDSLNDCAKLFDDYSNKDGIFGFGEPTLGVNGESLTKKEYLKRELDKMRILNDKIDGELQSEGIEEKDNLTVKKNFIFKNFKLVFDHLEEK